MKSVAAVIALFLAACAEDRYSWNLAHAWLNPRTPLPRKDLEEIVRLVSNTTNEPISAITLSRESGRLQADVSPGTTEHAYLYRRKARFRLVYRVMQ